MDKELTPGELGATHITTDTADHILDALLDGGLLVPRLGESDFIPARVEDVDRFAELTARAVVEDPRTKELFYRLARHLFMEALVGR
jgi:hypothetical protein